MPGAPCGKLGIEIPSHDNGTGEKSSNKLLHFLQVDLELERYSGLALAHHGVMKERSKLREDSTGPPVASYS